MARFPFVKRKHKNTESPGSPTSPTTDDHHEADTSFASNTTGSEYRHSYISRSPSQKPNISLPVPGSLHMPDHTGDYGAYNHGGNDDYGVSSEPVPAGPAPDNALTPWKRHKLFDSPFPRYRHSVSQISLEKNEIFLMGGLKQGAVFGDTWRLVPHISGNSITNFTASHVEVANKNEPPARVGHASVLCGNAYIIYGGDTVDTDYNGNPDDNFYMFNINNCKYTIPLHILNKPRGRYGHSIGVVLMLASSSRLYLFGGQLENEVFSDLYYFELTEFKLPKARWELVSPVNALSPPPLTNHSMCVHKTKIYVFGGVYNNEKVSNDLWCFDTVANKWLQVDTLGTTPLPVNEHSAVIANDHMYIYGGNDFAGTFYDSLYCLDLHTFRWTRLAKDRSAFSPGARCGHSMTYLPKLNKVIIMGGDKNDYIYSDPENYETHEEAEGSEPGTMIFELDLAVADHYLRGGSGPKKIAASAIGSGYGRRTTSPGPDDGSRHRRSFSAGPEDFRTPTGSVERLPRSLDPKLTAPAAALDPGPFTPQREPYSRSTTGGNGEFIDVDIPSSNISQNEGATDLDEVRDKYLAENGHDDSITSDNGHFETLRRENNETPILSKDFAREADLDDTIPPLSTVRSVETEEEPAPVSRGLNGSHEKAAAPAVAPEESARVKQVIAELNDEIAQLRQSTKEELQSASDRLKSLEDENGRLKTSHEKALAEKDAMIDELRRSIDPADLDIDDADTSSQVASKRGFTELTKYKLDRLELRNRLISLENENAEYRSRLERFEPFMENQIGELSSLQKVIESQENKISLLTSQVKLEEVLHKEIAEWKHKFEAISIEFQNYKAVHPEFEFENGTDEGEFQGESRALPQTAKLSTHLANLTSLWQATKQQDNDARLITTEDNAMVAKLQKQIDELIVTSRAQHEGSSAEVQALQAELEDKLQALRTFEQNYRDALQSVNNTSKALQLSHDELRNQKLTIEKLVKENNELKLFKKSKKRSSARNLGESNGNSPVPGTPAFGDSDSDNDEVEGGISQAHFNMKVKDLEADLYILKQEKEQLSDTVASLKKQLYLATNSS